MKNPREQKRMSDESVKQRTGKVWAEWYRILDKAGAKKWVHKDIANFLSTKQKISGWWSQMVAVDYEHARGIRKKFQDCAGSFSANSSRTLNASMAEIYKSWTDEKSRSKWLPGASMQITTATPGKSIRATWDDGKSRLSVNFYPKGAGKAQVAVDHMKLPNSKECAKMKAYWFGALNRLRERVEDRKLWRKSLRAPFPTGLKFGRPKKCGGKFQPANEKGRVSDPPL